MDKFFKAFFKLVIFFLKEDFENVAELGVGNLAESWAGNLIENLIGNWIESWIDSYEQEIDCKNLVYAAHNYSDSMKN